MTEQLNTEQTKLEATRKKLVNIIKNPSTQDDERMAMQFYLEDLQNKHTVADAQKFSKPKQGIGGTGDEEIRAKYVVRDHETDRPLMRNGKLVIIPCVFSSFERYLDIISSGKADSLRMQAHQGAYPANPEDKKYCKPNPYDFAIQAVLNSRGDD